jgi:eukaryotic-like serine/threonine-protein kinase
MASGKRAFRRETTAETMTAVLKEDPPELNDAGYPISPALDRIVRRCLEKTPDQRFQSSKDLSFALSALSGTDSSTRLQIAETQHKLPLLLWASIAGALFLAIGLTWLFARRPAVAERMQFAIPLSGEVSHFALSPDGTSLAFVSPEEETGIPMVSVQRIGTAVANVLAGTQGASYPFWSPNSSYLGFFANGKLMKIAVTGGTPQALATVESARGGSWGSRDVIVFAPDSGSPLWRVNADGTGAAPLTDHIFNGLEQSHRWPMFLPDGHHFLFWAGNFGNVSDDRQSGIFLSSLDGKEKEFVILAHSSFGLSTDRLFYADDQRHLVSIAFDNRKGTISGNSVIVANSVAAQPSTYWAAVTASSSGTVIYDTETGASLSVLTWMDRSGKVLGRVGEPAVQCNPTLSADGTRVAVDISDQKANNVDIWFLSTNGAGNSRFTFDPAEEVDPVWSRDGAQLAYRSAGGAGAGFGSLFLKPTSGLEHEKSLLKIQASDDLVPNAWAPGDKQILITHESPEGYHLELVPREGGKSTPLQKDRGNQVNGQISPDGKWMAYASDESGTYEIYVTTFPAGAGKWQVSRGGGTEPRWRGDGKEIFYLAPAGMMTAVPVSTVGAFSTGTPTSLFQFHGRAAISSTDLFSYDVTKDGKRFLVNRYVKPERITPLTIVLNASAKSPN